jgi:UDP-2,3-diacylglucosamine pyrophosphatase LpxH
MHIGAWTGDAVLSRPFARERLAPLLEEADELVLLGDVFDLLFSSVEHAFEQADPFFDLVAETMRGGRVVWLAGNHDHHIVVRMLRTLVETRVATGLDGDELARVYEAEQQSFFKRYLHRRLPGVETRLAYPFHEVGDVLLSHGHWLDAHMTGSLPNRLLTRGIWAVAGGRPDRVRLEDYEAVIVPLTELLFTVAQMPRGCLAQQGFHHQFERLGKAVRRATAVERGLKRVAKRNGTPIHERLMADEALDAYRKVVRNLGWDKRARKHVFAHTHRPLADERDSSGLRFWNTGSWIYEPELRSRESYVKYLERAWPGTAVVIDSETGYEPELVDLLADQNPLHGGDPSGLRDVEDMYTARTAELDPKLPVHAPVG